MTRDEHVALAVSLLAASSYITQPAEAVRVVAEVERAVEAWYAAGGHGALWRHRPPVTSKPIND